jgi:hypothetical protein
MTAALTPASRAERVSAETEYLALKTSETLKESRERIVRAEAALARLSADLSTPRPPKPTK